MANKSTILGQQIQPKLAYEMEKMEMQEVFRQSPPASDNE